MAECCWPVGNLKWKGFNWGLHLGGLFLFVFNADGVHDSARGRARGASGIAGGDASLHSEAAADHSTTAAAARGEASHDEDADQSHVVEVGVAVVAVGAVQHKVGGGFGGHNHVARGAVVVVPQCAISLCEVSVT